MGRLVKCNMALIPAGTGLVIPTTPGPALAKSAPPDEISSFYRLALPLNAIAGHAGLPQVTIPVAQIRTTQVRYGIG